MRHRRLLLFRTTLMPLLYIKYVKMGHNKLKVHKRGVIKKKKKNPPPFRINFV